MKKRFLVATHGQLASGFQSSLTILADKGAELNIVDAYLTDEDYTPLIEEFIESVGENEQGVIFTDLFGGSVNQKVVTKLMMSKKDQIFVISNSNLAIILTLVLAPEKEIFTQQTINEAINESQVRLVTTQLPKEETFF
ncbi:PTS mannose transporter subunit IIA [Enterococcus dongliensis]|uniref:PTS mannose transporter subunit IIA n=1 Tax=Enterococcus dongliensis TaxID=2559925 RepID=A0AAP5NMC0_9ENTE|nr:PTS mannose transporter subunit IIA [Enterococcus dongliensis]MDT2597802.1 PTS mannose transporter subunit IIA [Enterococcus dongliensis]MDT2602961.1 PTS mannose transporter subunit IIA [Enterococcus dongliensis]MDT2635743.1 PTS mannose transporter subunit IIA [Enterococcus dongliensis]MDT2638308.1 PTS mannose transporter subunit IIA [Enterococcus dongliensis]MDT2640966.1 PTS mannose transporter subunit IIA [Enterococcus dongliensis]